MSGRFNEAVEKHRKLILDTFDYVWRNPETGYREVKTNKYLKEAFEKLGYELTLAGNIPGFYTVVDTGRPGPEVLVLGEMDSLICPDHPEADPETGAVHCCGHAAQIGAFIGIAAALKEPGVLDSLSGRIRLCAVPAEELIEIEYRSKLKEQGIIKSYGGKSEFLRRGYFDGVDVALMVHTTVDSVPSAFKSWVGCLAKSVIYKGRSAHAGGSPWNGCNALYAAQLGLSAINSIRETFKESDVIRVHPIITKGGNAVNAIPDEVIVESYVRGRTFKAIEDANAKVNRALVGAALSLGANVDIRDYPGYAPLVNSAAMLELAAEAAGEVEELPEFEYRDRVGSGSTDMGDLSCVMPVVHPYVPGAEGISHGATYKIADPDLACVASAKWQLAMIELLLKNGGERAKHVKAEYVPEFSSTEEFFKYVDSLECSGCRINYSEDKSSAEVKL
ncbi:MAG: amidohydrolase [Ruminococcaceae bacterium]|nr:amidohydrolase [Oscillospiraceae bacterium]